MAPLVEEDDDEERESVSFTSKPKTETVTPGFTGNPSVQNWMNAPSEDEEDEDEDEDE